MASPGGQSPACVATCGAPTSSVGGQTPRSAVVPAIPARCGHLREASIHHLREGTPPPKQLDGGAPRTPWQHASVLSSSAQAASQLRHALPGQSQAASQPPRTLKVCVSLASTACTSFLCRHACAAAGLGTCLPSKRSHAGDLSRRLWPPFVSPTSRALCPSRQSVHSCPSPDLPPTCECCFPQAFLHTPLETRRRSSHCILTCSDRALDEAHARRPFWSH